MEEHVSLKYIKGIWHLLKPLIFGVGLAAILFSTYIHFVFNDINDQVSNGITASKNQTNYENYFVLDTIGQHQMIIVQSATHNDMYVVVHKKDCSFCKKYNENNNR